MVGEFGPRGKETRKEGEGVLGEGSSRCRPVFVLGSIHWELLAVAGGKLEKGLRLSPWCWCKDRHGFNGQAIWNQCNVYVTANMDNQLV